MEAFIGVFASATLLWVVYWGLLRSPLLNMVKDDLDSLRARVDWAIIEGREGAQSEACHQLEFVLRHSQCIWFVSFSHFVLGLWVKRREIAAMRAERSRLFNESPAWIRETQKHCAWLFIRAALLNSPAWWPFIPLLLFASQLSGKARAWWDDMQDRAIRFDGTIPEICLAAQAP